MFEKLPQFESLDYEDVENDLESAAQVALKGTSAMSNAPSHGRRERAASYRSAAVCAAAGPAVVELRRWVVMFLIGAVTACVAAVSSVAIASAASWKFSLLTDSINRRACQ